MSTTITKMPVATPLIGMGQTTLVRRPETARTVLGSCVGLVLFHRRRGIGMLAHIVLPEAAGRPGLPGKFADTAIPHMVETFEAEGAFASGLVAKIAGGANMFGSSGPLQVGDANIEAVVTRLEQLRIPLAAQDVGGAKGRRLTFDSDTGDVIVEIVGESPTTL